MSLAYDSERRYVNLDGAPIHEDTLPEDMSDADYGEWFGRSFVPGNVGCRVGPPVQRIASAETMDSAINCLREIASLGRKAGSELAIQWLAQHGYPLEAGGYVPGRGFLGEEG